MCGILGFVNIGSKEILSKSLDVIAHRGPDDQGVFWDDEQLIVLGYRRLSYIILLNTIKLIKFIR